ncbi:MAG: monofunctional biosynthetic peptidoglycan transglycosylase [Bacteroidota bacterium]
MALWGKRVLKWIIWFNIASVSLVIIYRFVPPPITILMIQRMVEQKWEGKDFKLSKTWKSIDEISTQMPLAVIAAEDQKFEEHFGFDIAAIEKAQTYNEKHKGKKTRGASTISQQTAKNVFLWPSRSWIRKGFEVYFTFLIEVFWSKERIMEVYLNVIETGDGIYGVEAASKYYFKKSASKISTAEAALIAAVLPNPRRWTPAKPTAYILKKQARIIRFMSNLGKIDL